MTTFPRCFAPCPENEIIQKVVYITNSMYPPLAPATVPLNSTYSEYSHFPKHENPQKYCNT
ncbi:uncharacterized protein BO87DRAFT_22838 [Aspergillus neoniger CBS 115656]|uniref:Uncharacterized protein n=1 Tax=Aspergillus neoniger (strain CBS 115656) TaxID=1448310 RepID=A0A318YMA8_ASPNB|nr:hypothetical protein BO87DRAFT_22838 [Aspergillus neoniger CBS 115656]PYH35745.1 hypothetical protein BO87DRAFT_22838 [Aspergillus neoniger CBS 115656]